MAGHCFELIPSGIFVFDGRKDDKNAVGDTFVYDFGTKIWTQVKSAIYQKIEIISF